MPRKQPARAPKPPTPRPESSKPALGLPKCRGSLWERIVIVHGRVNRGEKFTATSIAGELETDARTMERTFEYMRDRFGMMITWCHEQGRYIYDPPCESLPMVQIETDEDYLLKLLKQILPAVTGPVEVGRWNGLLKKLSLVAGGSNSFATENDLGVTCPSSPLQPRDSLHLQALIQARATRQELRVEYQSANATTPSPRVVHPLEFGYFQHWIVIVHDVASNGPLTFRLDRVHGVQPTGKTFERPTAYEPAEMLRGNIGAYTGKEDHLITLLLRDHAAKDARLKPWHPSQTSIERGEGRLEITLRLNNLVDITNKILYWGPQVEALSPSELRTRVRDMLAAALALYG